MPDCKDGKRNLPFVAAHPKARIPKLLRLGGPVFDSRKVCSGWRLLPATFILLLAAAMLTGCGSNNNSASNGSTNSGTPNPGSSNPGNGGGTGSGGSGATGASYVYVANYAQHLDAYSINNTDGSLSSVSGSPFQQGTTIADMVLADNTVVTVNYDGDLTSWSVDANSGALTKGTVVAGSHSWLASSGSNVYASTSDGVASFTASNGTLTPVGSPASLSNLCAQCAPTLLKASLNGKYLYAFVSGFHDVNGFAVFDIGSNGAASNPRLVQGVNNTTFPYDDEIVSPGNQWIYELSQETLRQYKFDPATGNATKVTDSAAKTGSGGNWGRFSPDGKYLLIVNNIGNSVSVFSFNSGTGALTEVSGSPFPTGSRPIRLAFDSSGKYVYVICSAQGTADLFGYKLDSASGALMQVAHQNVGGDPRAIAAK